MAIIKHIASKNADYGAAERYLTHKYNEFNNKPILDSHRYLIPREHYLITGINCTPDTFALECIKVNRAFHKNNTRSKLKSHHYIISFDPKDATDNWLSPERAQSLGIAFAKKFFPGYQTLICTHPDGHNGTGNIHVHIVINSIRMQSVSPDTFMERPSDCQAGHKHHVSNQYLVCLKQGLMDLCQKEHLYQVDLLSPAKVKVTDKEYWQQRRAKQQESPSEPTPFESRKDFLRAAIKQTLSEFSSLEEFQNKLFSKYGILLKESRGRFSYILPERTQAISSRMLGTDYAKTHIMEVLQSQMQQPKSILQQLSATPQPQSNTKSSRIRKATDLASCLKAQQNQFYARKVETSNLLVFSQTLAFLEESGIKTQDELNQLISSVTTDVSEKKEQLNQISAELKQTNELIHYTGQYQANKRTYKQYCSCSVSSKAAFYEAHQSKLLLFDAAKHALLQHYTLANIPPSLSDWKSKKEQLLTAKNQLYEDFSFARSKQSELLTIHQNIQQLLSLDTTQTPEHPLSLS